MVCARGATSQQSRRGSASGVLHETSRLIPEPYRWGAGVLNCKLPSG